jgi:hypothetical protein
MRGRERVSLLELLIILVAVVAATAVALAWLRDFFAAVERAIPKSIGG